MGEPCSIAPLITLAAWRSGKTPPFFVVGDPELYRRQKNPCPIHIIEDGRQAMACFAEALPIKPLKMGGLPFYAPMGDIHPDMQSHVRASIDEAITCVMQGEACAMTTNPIHKKALAHSRWQAQGHTDYLAQKCKTQEVVMMLASDILRVVPVTIHCALKEAIATLDAPKIKMTIAHTLAALRHDFGIAHPKIAVAGLNPHAGEEGLLGDEEIKIITPAIDEFTDEVEGVFAADGLFIPQRLVRYDAFICMYHDQALIAFKALSFASGVNVTLGLPIVRTSPAHGTALELASQGVADETSLISALCMAHDIARRRHHHNV